MDKMTKFRTAERYDGIEYRYWDEMLTMLQKYNPVNMAIGMPDFEALPDSIREALADVAINGHNYLHQYSSMPGHTRLVNVLAKLYSILLNLEVNPLDNVQITLGALEALHAIIMGLVNSGDEVILMEPYYEPYTTFVKLAGGREVFLPLRRYEDNGKISWKIDLVELESKFSNKTKMMIINTPHNPLGKVFTRQELEGIAHLCIKYNVILVSDEVYEWFTYGEHVHTRIASLPGMFERTISVGSIGKAFNVTGWKCGWALTGNKQLMDAIRKAHTIGVYLVPTPLQEAAARAFEIELDKMIKGDTNYMYWTQISQTILGKRNRVIKMISELGFDIVEPEGGYFLVVDCRPVMQKLDLTEFYDHRGKTFAFVHWLSKNGLQTFPISVWYSDENKHLAEGLLRLCFMKSDDSLDQTERVFIGLKEKLNDLSQRG